MAKATEKPEVARELDASAFYEGLLNELNAKGSREILYLKDGHNRLKLIAENPKDFFRRVQRPGYNGGKPTTKYVFKALLLGAEEPRIQAVVTGKKVLGNILQLLANGYELFTPDGPAIDIARSGEGLQTSYTVIPSPKAVHLPQEYEDLPMTLDEIVELIKKMDEERAARPAVEKSTVSGEEPEGEW